MTMKDFLIEAKRVMIEALHEHDIDNIEPEEHNVVKTNDSIQHGFILKRTDFPGGAMIYVDDLFRRHVAGEPIEYIWEELRERCVFSACCPLPPMIDLMDKSLDDIRSRLSVRLLDVSRNLSYMDGRPYIDVGNGLALIAYINNEEDIRSEWKVGVTDGVVRSLGCTGEELLTEALRNTIEMEPAVLMHLSDCMIGYDVITGEAPNLLCEDTEEDTDADAMEAECSDSRLYILTNTSRFMGAAAMFYPEVMERISEVVKGGYYVIPSSIHEMIVVPDDIGSTPDSLQNVLRHGNTVVVKEDELLSDRVFHYSVGDCQLRIAS